MRIYNQGPCAYNACMLAVRLLIVLCGAATCVAAKRDTLRLEVAFVNGKELYSWLGAGKFEDREICSRNDEVSFVGVNRRSSAANLV